MRMRSAGEALPPNGITKAPDVSGAARSVPSEAAVKTMLRGVKHIAVSQAW